MLKRSPANYRNASYEAGEINKSTRPGSDGEEVSIHILAQVAAVKGV